jgi:hypothetical protein
MEEQWNVIYVDISNREMTSRTLDSRESARLHAATSIAIITRFCG